MEKNSKKRGLIIGKFMPCHLGHKYLIDFARNYTDIVDIIVCSLKNEPIDGKLRYYWVKNMFPDLNIHHYNKDIPQYPEEHVDFWKLWKKAIKSKVKGKIDYVFASEEYGFKLAEILNAKFIPVNIARDLIPISGTRIREKLYEYWDFLPEEVKKYYLKRVCIYGPESTGKSTLTKKLANHFKTNSVNEYARDLIDTQNGKLSYDDIEVIAKGHKASQQSLEKLSSKVIFVDTDVITTKIWSKILYGKCPEFIKKASKKPKYDLYLLLDVDVPWIEDVQRYLPNKRQWFFDLCKKELDKIGANYIVISGDWEERLDKSIKAVNKLLEY